MGKNSYLVITAVVKAGGDWVQLDLSGSAKGGSSNCGTIRRHTRGGIRKGVVRSIIRVQICRRKI
jgi:hypothetical protein